MTAQFSDTLQYEEKDYEIAGINGDGLFNPAQYKMKPIWQCTACWRGFVTRYQVENDELHLTALSISLTDVDWQNKGRKFPKIQPPIIEGYKAIDMSVEQWSLFEYYYTNMRLLIPFTGGLLLTRDFIEDLHVHMGFHPAWKYRTVYELLFEKGRLIRSIDISKKMAEIRLEMKEVELKPYLDTSEKDVTEWVEQCFTRDYKL